MHIQFCLWAVLYLGLNLSYADDICEIREDNLDVVFNCCNRLINDDIYFSTFESIHAKIQSQHANIYRKIHVLIEDNGIKTVKRIPQLNHVSKISFKRNQIEDADTGAFRNLPDLRILDFGENAFTGDNLTGEIFRGIEEQDNFQPLQLEHLGLADNRITYLRFDLFKYLPNLLSLELNNNPIEYINRDTERALHSLKNLKVLNLAQVGISHVPNLLFEALPVESLYLNENRFTEIPKSLSQTSTIRYLNLNDNPILEINSQSFVKLIRLQKLHLNGMKNLSKIEENAFLTLVNLETLQCSFNPNLRFIHPKAFSWKTNRKLKELYINNNGLQTVSENLIDWYKLEVLNLRGNPWNCTCSLQWLFNLIDHVQHYNPESNLGVWCQYPQMLNKRSLIFAKSYLQCDNESAAILTNSRSMNFVIWMAALAVLYIILQLIYFKMVKNKSKPRHSGTSIKSTVKYKPAQSMIYL